MTKIVFSARRARRGANFGHASTRVLPRTLLSNQGKIRMLLNFRVDFAMPIGSFLSLSFSHSLFSSIHAPRGFYRRSIIKLVRLCSRSSWLFAELST